MACKVLCAFLAAFCAAQVMALPAQVAVQPQVTEDKGLIADINAAIKAVNALQDSIVALKDQINRSLVVLTVDTAVQIRDIIKQLQDIGISTEELLAAEAAINQSLANVEAVFVGIVVDLDNILVLTGQILSDLGNFNLVQMARHILDLDEAFKKLEADASTIVSRITAEFNNIFDTIIYLTIGEPIEIVQKITSDVLRIGQTWSNEGTKLWTAFTAVIDAAAAALDALWNVVSSEEPTTIAPKLMALGIRKHQ
ncbi:uncharacterized protein LOC132204361 [Neocloeon triangulifer]|uniref:uncharacterized protein LOC132204361 n=1 Tax=Neocloeon triangulifer TaxID=2078957 RepID=UPI00286F63EA|nr:uncharacterized protein LOC132204361 [Neocloeon triangulifer]